jgi:hypothetical protein
VSVLLGALFLFSAGAFLGGGAATLLWALSFLALASELLARLSPRRPASRPRTERRRGPISLDEVLIREELAPLGLEQAALDDLTAAAQAFGRARGIDPLAVARAMGGAIEGESEELALLGWVLPPGLGRAAIVMELRAGR